MAALATIPTAIPGSRVRVCFGPGELRHVGALARDLGATRVLLISDPGIAAAGHVARAAESLRQAGLATAIFIGVGQNPTTDHVAAGLTAARQHDTDFLVGLGGGSAMDCAKAINFLLTNGGRMQDYWGINKATRPMLPLIAIPTTAGTGSEAQSYALITDPETHQKMACGDVKAQARLAILDPELTATVPPMTAAATGIDALAHAVETAASTRRNAISRRLSHDAWELLESSFAPALANPADPLLRERMLMGAHLAGAAIENSMLGAAHACANPLTARFGIVHGAAVGLMLPYVVAFNSRADNPYDDLQEDPARLVARLRTLLAASGLPGRVQDYGVPRESLPELAALAARQWTATFNPRPVGPGELEQIYLAAWNA